MALSQELSDFLIEFAIALHRISMYPQGHPSLERSAAMVVTRLAALLLERTSVSIGVASKQLVIEGVATDPEHPVLRSLAGRLHRHQLGAIVLERGVAVEELVDMMRVVAVEPEDGSTPLGLGDPNVLRQWQHVRLYPLTYEQLELVADSEAEEAEAGEEREPGTHSAQLWIGLARAALAMEDEASAPEAAEPAVVAEAINRHPGAQAYDQVIVGYLLQLAEELRKDGGLTSHAVRKRLSRLVGALDEQTLQRLISMGGDVVQRRKFVLDATEALAADAVVDIVQAAATSSSRTISDSMVRLLTKLSAFAEQGPQLVQIHADSALREQVQQLVENWQLDDPNPDAYTRALGSLARRGMTLPATTRTEYPPEPLRLVQMALELDAATVPFWRAVGEVLEDAPIDALLATLAGAPADNHVAAALWDHLTAPELVSQLLARENLDLQALGPIFDRMAPAALAPLLMDVLIEAESRSTRLAAFKRLAAMDLATIEPEIVRGLKDERWYVQRNMLALLNELGAYSEAVSPHTLARHDDPRVRREALEIWMRNPRDRERALCTALADPDERSLRAGVAEARVGVPEEAVPLIARRALEPLPPDLRSALLRLLRGQHHPLALDVLLRTASVGHPILGRYRLAPSSPETLAALAVLADTWAEHPRAAALLARARRAADPEIRAAAQAPVRTTPAE